MSIDFVDFFYFQQFTTGTVVWSFAVFEDFIFTDKGVLWPYTYTEYMI